MNTIHRAGNLPLCLYLSPEHDVALLESAFYHAGEGPGKLGHKRPFISNIISKEAFQDRIFCAVDIWGDDDELYRALRLVSALETTTVKVAYQPRVTADLYEVDLQYQMPGRIAQQSFPRLTDVCLRNCDADWTSWQFCRSTSLRNLVVAASEHNDQGGYAMARDIVDLLHHVPLLEQLTFEHAISLPYYDNTPTTLAPPSEVITLPNLRSLRLTDSPRACFSLLRLLHIPDGSCFINILAPSLYPSGLKDIPPYRIAIARWIFGRSAPAFDRLHVLLAPQQLEIRAHAPPNGGSRPRCMDWVLEADMDIIDIEPEEQMQTFSVVLNLRPLVLHLTEAETRNPEPLVWRTFPDLPAKKVILSQLGLDSHFWDAFKDRPAFLSHAEEVALDGVTAMTDENADGFAMGLAARVAAGSLRTLRLENCTSFPRERIDGWARIVPQVYVDGLRHAVE